MAGESIILPFNVTFLSKINLSALRLDVNPELEISLATLIFLFFVFDTIV